MPTTAVPNILVGPGYLFWAPLGTAVPTNTVTASKFSDAWPVAWIPLGATQEGTTEKWSTKVEAIEVAEFLDPIQWATTGREGSVAAALADYTLANLKRAMNGGTQSVVSGTGATTLTKLEPPIVGAEVRCMIGWESVDSTLRSVFYQCFQGGEMESKYAKAPDKATIPVEFKLEVPTSGIPWTKWAAGTVRAGV